MARISVLIAARNAESTINAAVRSALRALPRDAEVLVMDDASNDGTVGILRGLRDRRLRLFTADEQCGSGTRRTELLQHAEGRSVAILDADDISLPWRFQATDRLLSSSDIVFTTAIRFYQDKPKARPTCWRPLPPRAIPYALLMHNPIVHSTVVARRDALNRIGGYRSMLRGQDYDLWLRAARVGLRFRHLAVPTASYRQSRSQISRTGDYDHVIAHDPMIVASFSSLLQRLVPMSAATHASVTAARALALPALAAEIDSFGLLARSYYAGLLNRFPPNDTRTSLEEVT